MRPISDIQYTKICAKLHLYLRNCRKATPYARNSKKADKMNLECVGNAFEMLKTTTDNFEQSTKLAVPYSQAFAIVIVI